MGYLLCIVIGCLIGAVGVTVGFHYATDGKVWGLIRSLRGDFYEGTDEAPPAGYFDERYVPPTQFPV